MTNRKTIIRKLSEVLRKPSLIIRIFKNRLVGAYRLYIEKDEFTIAANKWFRDKGDETLRLKYSLDQDSIVIDIGGYKGEYAESIYHKYGCHIYIYEPVKLNFLECAKRFSNNEKIKCLNYGLSDSSGSFYISDEDNGSSLIKNNTSRGCEKVFVKQFNEEIESLKLDHIDLLKMNVEGAEFLILPHIINNKKMITKIENIQIQFHTFYPNAKKLRDEIRAKLSETHKEEWNYPFVWESWRLKSKEANLVQPYSLNT